MSFQRFPSNSRPPEKSSVPSTAPQNHGKSLLGRFGSFPRSLFHLIFGLLAKDALPVQRRGHHERSNVQPHTVVDVGLPPDGLLMKRFPAHEEIVRWLALDNLLELLLEVQRRGQLAVSSFLPLLLLGPLAADPVTEIGVRQLLERIPSPTVRRRQLVIVDQRMEPITLTVPDVPHERPLMEDGTMLLEETVTKPILKCLPGEVDLRQKLRLFRRRPLLPVCGRQQPSQALVRSFFPFQ